MSSVNSVHILGNVGRDPEVRYAPSGTAICSLAVATSRAWKDKNTGEKQEETEWHNVTLFDRQAEVAGEYLRKGSKVYIDGRLKTEKWQDKDGNDRYTTKIIASNLVLIDRREQGGEAPSSGRAPASSRAPAPQRGRSSKPAQARSSSAFDDMDMDVPF